MSAPPPLKAFALIDSGNTISLVTLISADRRDEYEQDLVLLTEKLARKNETHSLRLIPVTITPDEAAA